MTKIIKKPFILKVSRFSPNRIQVVTWQFWAWLLLLLVTPLLVAAFPSDISVQGVLGNSSGSAINGSFDFSLRIYDSYTGGSWKYEHNKSVSIGADGVYTETLPSVLLPFDKLYFSDVIVEDETLTPRLNLSVMPYSFWTNNTEFDPKWRANFSDVWSAIASWFDGLRPISFWRAVYT